MDLPLNWIASSEILWVKGGTARKGRGMSESGHTVGTCPDPRGYSVFTRRLGLILTISCYNIHFPR